MMRRPYTKSELNNYQKDLTTVAMLSNLFASGTTPIIYYRATENLYCRSFNARNTSRADNTADAIFDLQTGVGIKTFIYKEGGSWEKVAEFDQQIPEYSSLHGLALAKKIASLRNTRIDTTMRNYGLKSMIYHCILRSSTGEISVFETPMHRIDISSITHIIDNGKCLQFSDCYRKYKFYRSKSTLCMHFKCENPILQFHVDIIEDPIETLSRLITDDIVFQDPFEISEEDNTLIIPLFSESKKNGRRVGAKSGLNSWNASQTHRKRDPDEIYIPYPKELQRSKPGFFPGRDQSWSMTLPDGKVLSMKVCQAGDKAIMSNPNTAIGHWLLRDVLHVNPGEVVTYEFLLDAGITSIKIKKNSDLNYSCDFIQIDNE